MTTDHRIWMAATCALVGVLSGISAGLGVLARGSDVIITVVSARGETDQMHIGNASDACASRPVATA